MRVRDVSKLDSDILIRRVARVSGKKGSITDSRSRERLILLREIRTDAR